MTVNSKQPTVYSRSIASFFVLVIPLAFLAYRDIEPRETARAARATLDPQTNSLRYVSAAGFTEVDYARHVEELKARIKKKLAAGGASDRSAGRSSDGSPGGSADGSARSSDGSPGGTDGSGGGSADRFSIVVEKPFVVVGDEAESVVKERAEGTVKWAVTKLKQDFFTKDPKEILDIWLFKDEESYEKHAQLFFGKSHGRLTVLTDINKRYSQGADHEYCYRGVGRWSMRLCTRLSKVMSNE